MSNSKELSFPQRGVKGVYEIGVWSLGMCSLSQTYRLVYHFFLVICLCQLPCERVGALTLRGCLFLCLPEGVFVF